MGFFFIFPALILISEVVFLAVVIVSNHRSAWQGNWKDSALPLLFQNLQLDWPYYSELDKENMKEELSHTRAKLVPDDDDDEGPWKFSKKLY